MISDFDLLFKKLNIISVFNTNAYKYMSLIERCLSNCYNFFK